MSAVHRGGQPSRPRCRRSCRDRSNRTDRATSSVGGMMTRCIDIRSSCLSMAGSSRFDPSAVDRAIRRFVALRQLIIEFGHATFARIPRTCRTPISHPQIDRPTSGSLVNAFQITRSRSSRVRAISFEATSPETVVEKLLQLRVTVTSPGCAVRIARATAARATTPKFASSSRPWRHRERCACGSVRRPASVRRHVRGKRRILLHRGPMSRIAATDEIGRRLAVAADRQDAADLAFLFGGEFS